MSITGAMRSTPSKALSAALYMIPLHQYVQMEAAKSALRLKRTQGECNSVEHSKILAELKINQGVLMIEDWMESKLELDVPFKVVETNRQEWESGGPHISPGSIIF